MKSLMISIGMMIMLVSNSALSANLQPRVSFVTEHWPPYNYVDEHGDLAGLSVDKLRKALKKLGWQENIELFHWAKSFHHMKNKPNTFIFSIYPTEERLSEYQWICPLVKTEPVSFYKLASRKDIVLTEKSDAKKYLTGVIRDGLAIETLKNAGFDERSHLYIASDDNSNLLQLIQGRIDLIVDEKNAIKYRLEKLGKNSDLLAHLMPISDNQSTELCLATSLKTDKSIVEKLAMTLSSIDDSIH